MIISSSCRNINLKSIACFNNKANPKAGDILLVRVVSMGEYNSIETPDGKLRKISIGDNILVAQGNRYATQSQEVFVSEDDLILGSLGGVVGRSGNKIEQTQVKAIGYAFDGKKFLNIKNFPVISKRELQGKNNAKKPKVVAVFGSDMDSGKTMCAAYLAKNFNTKGMVVNYGKVTGTARLKDSLRVKKYGASMAFDFTDLFL